MQRYNIFPNQQNYKCFIDDVSAYVSKRIYNSRNYKCLIDDALEWLKELIYNSRNYKCLIDRQQCALCSDRSTMVEIINVL